ncbi:MAG TPA: hypothetical protein VGE72_24985 [Azospirillum sp.]
MTTNRTTTKTVTFTRPFRLRALDEERPAGTYTVEIEEELIEHLSFPVYRRTGSWIRLTSPPGGDGSVQVVPIDPEELEAAEQATDEQPTGG